MASAIVLEGPPPPRRKRGDLGAPTGDTSNCRCVPGGRNRQLRMKLCRVPKGKKHPSGWKFSGRCDR